MFLLLWRVISHGQYDLRGYGSVRCGILVKEVRVVGRFLVTVFRLRNIRDCWFH